MPPPEAYGTAMEEHGMSALTISILAAFAVIAALFSYAALVSGWRLFRGDGRLRLIEAVRGQGLTLPAMDTQRAARDGARATRRCLSCASHARCDDILAARDWNALREICPNTLHIDRLRAD
jgi:hypothetical protein